MNTNWSYRETPNLGHRRWPYELAIWRMTLKWGLWHHFGWWIQTGGLETPNLANSTKPWSWFDQVGMFVISLWQILAVDGIGQGPNLGQIRDFLAVGVLRKKFLSYDGGVQELPGFSTNHTLWRTETEDQNSYVHPLATENVSKSIFTVDNMKWPNQIWGIWSNFAWNSSNLAQMTWNLFRKTRQIF